MPTKKQQLNSDRQPQIVIANDLRSGLTVFLTASGDWSEHIIDALIVTDEAAASVAAATAARDESANKVTGAYLADSNKQGLPLVLRESLRVDGPSINYRHHSDLAGPALNAAIRTDHFQKELIQEAPIRTAPIHTAPIQTAQGKI